MIFAFDLARGEYRIYYASCEWEAAYPSRFIFPDIKPGGEYGQIFSDKRVRAVMARCQVGEYALYEDLDVTLDWLLRSTSGMTQQMEFNRLLALEAERKALQEIFG